MHGRLLLLIAAARSPSPEPQANPSVRTATYMSSVSLSLHLLPDRLPSILFWVASSWSLTSFAVFPFREVPQKLELKPLTVVQTRYTTPFSCLSHCSSPALTPLLLCRFGEWLADGASCLRLSPSLTPYSSSVRCTIHPFDFSSGQPSTHLHKRRWLPLRGGLPASTGPRSSTWFLQTRQHRHISHYRLADESLPIRPTEKA